MISFRKELTINQCSIVEQSTNKLFKSDSFIIIHLFWFRTSKLASENKEIDVFTGFCICFLHLCTETYLLEGDLEKKLHIGTANVVQKNIRFPWRYVTI